MRRQHDPGGGTASGIYIRSAESPCEATQSDNDYCLRGGERKTALDSWPAEAQRWPDSAFINTAILGDMLGQAGE